MCLINSIKHEHSCKILYITQCLGSIIMDSVLSVSCYIKGQLYENDHSFHGHFPITLL